MSPLYYGSNGDGWFSVFVIVPVIGLVIWGLNTFWLHRLKKGDMDYSPDVALQTSCENFSNNLQKRNGA